MNKKYIILFVLLFLIILIAGVFTIKKLKQKDTQAISIEDEYTPEEEITEEQSSTRDTVVTVYFPNKDTKKISPEARTVDVRNIVNNPYQELMNLLMEGPKSEKLEKIIPENTLLLGSNLENDVLTLNLSNEILNYKVTSNDEVEISNAKENLISSIVNTMTELSEVGKVKIIIEGQPNEEFAKEYERSSEN